MAAVRFPPYEYQAGRPLAVACVSSPPCTTPVSCARYSATVGWRWPQPPGPAPPQPDHAAATGSPPPAGQAGLSRSAQSAPRSTATAARATVGAAHAALDDPLSREPAQDHSDSEGDRDGHARLRASMKRPAAEPGKERLELLRSRVVLLKNEREAWELPGWHARAGPGPRGVRGPGDPGRVGTRRGGGTAGRCVGVPHRERRRGGRRHLWLLRRALRAPEP
jgi:hypothetical protein